MDLRKTKLYQAIKDPRVLVPELWNMCYDYITSKKNINLTDSATCETFMHVLSDHVTKLCSQSGVSVIYLMASSGISLDARDEHGETCLHKAARSTGTHRVVVALIRCGVDPLIRNNDGKTADDILTSEQPEHWKRTLHWLNKFKPGLCHALSQDPDDNDVDDRCIERLLKSWCRTRITREDGQDVDVANVLTMSDNSRAMIQKYAHTNELVISLLAGKPVKNDDIDVDDIDVNTQDHSHEVESSPHHALAQPLLMSVWETRHHTSVTTLLALGADTNVLYAPTGDKTESAPLFFHLIQKDNRPLDQIVHSILQVSDMPCRDQDGQTLLFRAISSDYSSQFIKSLFKYGVNIATRDRKGRTARDLAEVLKKTQYLTVIDEYVIEMAKDCNVLSLQELVLQGYDHISDITDNRGFNLANVIKHHRTQKDKAAMVIFIEKIPAIQEHLMAMFHASDTGDTDELRKLTSRKFARAQDKCGRTLLHKAILNKKKDMIKYIIDTYPDIRNMQDNLGRTALHYAYLVTEGMSLVNYLIFKRLDTTVTDWADKAPDYYNIAVCGRDEYVRLQNSMKSFSMDVYLAETNFEKSLMMAIKKGILCDVEQLVLGLTNKCDINRYANVLFHCVDTGNQNIAVYLIRQGMRTDIYRQYETCNPADSPCATYTCNHKLTSLYTHAKKMNCWDILKTIDGISLNKAAPELDGRPIVTGPSTMDQFALLGLV